MLIGFRLFLFTTINVQTTNRPMVRVHCIEMKLLPITLVSFQFDVCLLFLMSQSHLRLAALHSLFIVRHRCNVAWVGMAPLAHIILAGRLCIVVVVVHSRLKD